MNRRVRLLLGDYLRRMRGLWPFLGLAYVMQITSFWVGHVERWPLLGAILASLVFYATRESPQTVLRTLPISSAESALFRWWASMGVPGLFVGLCAVVSWFVSSEWPRPPASDVVLSAAIAWSVVAWLAVLPLPALHPQRIGLARFSLLWGALLATSFYGVPMALLSPTVVIGFVVAGIALSIVACVRAAFGHTTTLSVPRFSSRKVAEERAPKTARLHGWSIIAADVARSTVVLSVVALIAATVARWAYPILDRVVPFSWIFVSAVAVAACLQTRRWVTAMHPLRMLPIGHRRLAVILFVIVVTPGAVACLVAMGAWHLSPRLGVNIPYYMLVAFPLGPLMLIPWQQRRLSASPAGDGVQQWTIAVQQIAWPVWAGALTVFGGPLVPPDWVLAILVVVALGLTIVGYVALLAGIRSSAPLALTPAE